MIDIIRKLRAILSRREKWQVVMLLFAIVVMAFLQAVGVASVLPFIGLVMDPKMVFENRWLLMVYEGLNFRSVNRFLVFAGVVMFAVIFISNGVSAFATWLKLRFAWMNNHRLSRRLLEKYLTMPYVFFLNQNSADLSKNVLTEVNTLTNSYLIPLLNIITRSMVIVFMLIMLLLVDITLTLIAFLIIGSTYGLIILRINRVLKQRGALRMRANEMRFKAVSESFGGIKEIKVMNREPYFLQRYSAYSYRIALLMSWNAVIGQIPRFILEAIAFGGIIVFVLSLLLTRGEVSQVIPLVSLFAFAGYRLLPALQELFTSYTQMQFNKAILDRIYADFVRKEANLPVGTFAARKSIETMPLNKEITLADVSYHYPNSNRPVIAGINLSIPANTAVALVGSTGVGKTTLVDIILGLLFPSEGSLLVDGVVIDKNNLIEWQRSIGYVPQQIFLSDDTVARNIAFGVPDREIDSAALERAAGIANIDDFITQELPNSFDTVVGERGIRLSGGQRQRIGIARALYYDPAVLVFDEATSALDGITEDAVLDAMDRASKMKTMIIIAHRLSTVNKCEVIYMLKKGKIIASGTYDQLYETNTEFQKMAKAKM